MKFCIWTGSSWETWGPWSLETGIGGSETAALHVSAGLAALGHEVEVLGQVTNGRWRGVLFKQVYHDIDSVFSPSVDCDVFVSSRQIGAVSLLDGQLRARRRVLWMHDVHVGPDPGNLAGDYDDVFCLSRWAADVFALHYPSVDAGRVVLTRNGVDGSLYFGTEPRKQGLALGESRRDGPLVVYSSSPDRGLDKLLDYWPEVQRMAPGARLLVMYGFDTWEKIAAARGDLVGQLKVQILKSRLTKMAGDGVVYAGRAGQRDVADAYMRAALWLYPTDFTETSCITAMEAQSAGCDVVCTRLAALAETVDGKTGHLVDPPSQLRRYREEFLGKVEEVLSQDRDDAGMTARGRAAREAARARFSWSGVARQWSDYFGEKLCGDGA